jgi:hypothetical protein
MEKIKIRQRIEGKLAPAQTRRLAKARKLIAAELPDLIRRNQMRHDARKEKTFSGVLRRVAACRTRIPFIADESRCKSWHPLERSRRLFDCREDPAF